MNIGVLKGALVYALPHQQKNMQYSPQTHTRDNAPRAKTENVNERKEQDKKYLHPLTLSFNKSTTTCAHDLYRDKLQGLSVNRQKRTEF